MRAYEIVAGSTTLDGSRRSEREFSFDEAAAGIRHLESGVHFGKVVVGL
jgi:hypothetical protein